MPEVSLAGTVVFFDNVRAEVVLSVETKKDGAPVGKIVHVQSSNSRAEEVRDKVIVLRNGDIPMSPRNAKFVPRSTP